jgi:MOSC domain-containing protein YiiM
VTGGPADMRVVSVNVGRPREVEWRGEVVRTSIWKRPVGGRVRVARLNLAGDEQSDLTVHGGTLKAVYAYPAEHYPAWRREIPALDLASFGAFGENLTVEGLREDTLAIGDRLRIGTAELVVTQPRFPCFKLGIRHGRDALIQEFMTSGRSGFYLSVAREGEVGAGEPITFAERSASGVTVTDIVRLYRGDEMDPAFLARAAEAPQLSEQWRARFHKRLAAMAEPGST